MKTRGHLKEITAIITNMKIISRKYTLPQSVSTFDAGQPVDEIVRLHEVHVADVVLPRVHRHESEST